ncbi:MAG: hypothetical protein QOF78_1921, partial [Phycisphaerales bacterium]|nr:hypothetical protein [Phycisphaerales bacterium]
MVQMRTTHLLIAMMLAIALAAPAHGVASDAREQWMIQTRAADAIGEVLMDASDRAERQVDLLRRELTKAEPKSAAAAAGGAKSIRAPGSGGAQTAYRDLAARVVAEVERTAKDQNDPSL